MDSEGTTIRSHEGVRLRKHPALPSWRTYGARLRRAGGGRRRAPRRIPLETDRGSAAPPGTSHAHEAKSHPAAL